MQGPPFGPENPALHWQLVTAGLPAGEAEFARQSVHAALPLLALYLPAAQAAHEPPSGPVNPTLQVQMESAALPLGELELLGHARHVASSVAPVLVEYLPAPQSVHKALEIAPMLVEYLPAPQSVHDTLPLLALYLPAAQAAHEPPSGPVNPTLQVQMEKRCASTGRVGIAWTNKTRCL